MIGLLLLMLAAAPFDLVAEARAHPPTGGTNASGFLFNPDPDSAFVKCSALEGDLEPTLLCVFNHPEPMNTALLRAGIFIETTEGIRDHETHLAKDPFNNPHFFQVAGHDYQSADLQRFVTAYDAVRASFAEPSDPADLERLKNEDDFWNGTVKPWIAAHPDGVLLAVSIDHQGEFDADHLSHELLHAQFFNNSDYRNTVLGFWRDLDPSDRAAVRHILAAKYDTTNDTLMANELQSYLFQRDAGSDVLGRQLGALVGGTVTKRLRDALQAAGLEPTALADPPATHSAPVRQPAPITALPCVQTFDELARIQLIMDAIR